MYRNGIVPAVPAATVKRSILWIKGSVIIYFISHAIESYIMAIID